MHKSSFECLIGSVLCIKARIRNGPGPLALSRSLKRLNNIESDRCAQGGGLYSERSGNGGGLRAQRSILLKARKGKEEEGK
jgi:hypothetical protein